VKAIKQAAHSKKRDVDEIRLSVEEHFFVGRKYALGLPIAVPKRISGRTQEFVRKTDI
jgi:hypothetical protein